LASFSRWRPMAVLEELGAAKVGMPMALETALNKRPLHRKGLRKAEYMNMTISAAPLAARPVGATGAIFPRDLRLELSEGFCPVPIASSASRRKALVAKMLHDIRFRKIKLCKSYSRLANVLFCAWEIVGFNGGF
jgi:hypothetical protein